MGNNKTTIAITGATGFIGSNLCSFFESKGYIIAPISRQLLQPENVDQLSVLLSQTEIVINLAGASINKRWSKKYKHEMYESRVNTTIQLVETINLLDSKPSLFISASAVGYYPSVGVHNEYTRLSGESFLSELCQKWEQEANKLSSDVRLVITRLGVVLAPKGGAFGMMSLPSRLGISTIIGPGNQAFPWIDLDDLMRAIELIVDNEYIEGPVNMVSPERTNNRWFTTRIAKHFGSYFTIKIPHRFFKIFFGESSQFMCEGQTVTPTKLLKHDFKFSVRTIEEFCQKLK